MRKIEDIKHFKLFFLLILIACGDVGSLPGIVDSSYFLGNKT